MAKSRMIIGLITIVTTVVLDQISKFVVETYLPFQTMVPVMPFLAMFRTWNEGVAFSFLSGFGSWGLVVLAGLVVLLVLFLWRSAPKDRIWLNIGYGMIIGGALGNIIDRSIYGHVVDFVLVYYGNWSFAIFNLADSFISIGVALILLDEILNLRQKSKNG